MTKKNKLPRLDPLNKEVYVIQGQQYITVKGLQKLYEGGDKSVKHMIAVISRIKAIHKIKIAVPQENGAVKVMVATWPREKTDGKKGK